MRRTLLGAVCKGRGRVSETGGPVKARQFTADEGATGILSQIMETEKQDDS